MVKDDNSGSQILEDKLFSIMMRARTKPCLYMAVDNIFYSHILNPFPSDNHQFCSMCPFLVCFVVAVF